MSCTIVGALVVSCLVDPATRPTPAEAARILEPYQFVYVEPAPPMGPTVVIFGSNPTDGPFGPFPALPQAPRLDGSMLSAPPWHVTAYGSRPFHLSRPHAPARQHVQILHPDVLPSVGPKQEQAPQVSKASPRGTGWPLQSFRADGSSIGVK
jgi:hypothetical protein